MAYRINLPIGTEHATMPQIIVVNQSGEESNVEASEGRTLMEVIRDNGYDELLALCGGC